jgi:Methyltransferase domain
MNAAPLVDRLRFEAWKLRDVVHDRIHGRFHRQRVFQRIYDRNLWGDAESVSGGGSGTLATRTIRQQLPALLERFGIRSLLDAPCGDFHWMQHVATHLDRYVGVDIVPDLVERNSRRFESATISFACADIASDPLPSADAILCRDCFIHLPTRLIFEALVNFRVTGARYLLLTNDRQVDGYHDIPIGSFRPINFALSPFGFPEPLWALDEMANSSRQLCLWHLDSLAIDARRRSIR